MSNYEVITKERAEELLLGENLGIKIKSDEVGEIRWSIDRQTAFEADGTSIPKVVLGEIVLVGKMFLQTLAKIKKLPADFSVCRERAGKDLTIFREVAMWAIFQEDWGFGGSGFYKHHLRDLRGVNWNGASLTIEDVFIVGNKIKEGEILSVEEALCFLGIPLPVVKNHEVEMTKREKKFIGCWDSKHLRSEKEELLPLPGEIEGRPDRFYGHSYSRFEEGEPLGFPCCKCGCSLGLREYAIAHASNGAINPGVHKTQCVYCQWCGERQ